MIRNKTVLLAVLVSLMAVVTLTASDNKSYKISDKGPAGGIVFYDKGEYSDGWRYLEVAPADMATKLRWVAESYGDNYYSFPDIIGTQTDVGSGKRNTELILAKDPNAPAAKACKDYTGGGKNDWFLPSKDELDLMYENLYQKDSGGYNYYWSSSQDSTSSAWCQHLNDGYQISYYDKSNAYAVKAVRAF